MFRVNKLADYGTSVMVYLAKASDSVHNAKEIAEKTHLPLPTVTKILKKLVQAKLVHSKQGACGGYALQRPVDQIQLLEILEALDKKVNLVACSLPGLCAIEAFCPTKGNWQQLEQSLRLAMASLTLNALATPHTRFQVNIKTCTQSTIPMEVAA